MRESNKKRACGVGNYRKSIIGHKCDDCTSIAVHLRSLNTKQ